MRKSLAASVCGLFLVACGHGSPTQPTNTPNGTTTKANNIVVALNQAVDRAANAIAITIKGAANSDELINGLPLTSAFSSSDRWSGAVLHVLSYNAVVNGKTGWSGTTNIPFNPPSQDHFQFDSVPTGGTVDIALQVIPGNQPTGGPFHIVNVDPSASNVTITSTTGVKYTFKTDSDGMVHIQGARPF